jgi:precorrin-6A synthase
VMLDGQCAFQQLAPAGIHIWWGAYLGMPNQLCISGPLAEVGGRIVAQREAARAAHGWIMDTYLLRKHAA